MRAEGIRVEHFEWGHIVHARSGDTFELNITRHDTSGNWWIESNAGSAVGFVARHYSRGADHLPVYTFDAELPLADWRDLVEGLEQIEHYHATKGA